MVLTTEITAASPIYLTFFQPTYVATNDLAAYTAPVVLFACNSRVRTLLIDTAKKPITWVGSIVRRNQIQPAAPIVPSLHHSNS
ncbi:hypothetical protein PMAYCL1PPCAC_09092 [Pristionchus mayeri]|uniref:G protein-coupled receptor n=1 Tax=Pristionchus mayeri TaxID=1317129 RepID=A0AAN5CD00_9BILA|nr:hypothetical protein PMAYCL1PPCAC_09092 [Pristionchus mayeri]